MVKKIKNYSTEKSCTACGLSGDGVVCLHHVKTRGSGGSDHPSNLMPLCQSHHNQIHMKGTTWMSAQFSGVLKWLIENGWEIGQKGWIDKGDQD